MKTIIKESFKQLLPHKYLLFLLSFLLLLSLSLAIYIGLSIRPSELQLISHYSAFGLTHLYRDQWYYLLVFLAFDIVAAVFHTIISIKLLIIKSRSFAIMFAWCGIGMILLNLTIFLSVINLWKPPV